MPRNQNPIHAITRFFQTAPLDVAATLLAVVQETVKVRKQAENTPAVPTFAPAVRKRTRGKAKAKGPQPPTLKHPDDAVSDITPAVSQR